MTNNNTTSTAPGSGGVGGENYQDVDEFFNLWMPTTHENNHTDDVTLNEQQQAAATTSTPTSLYEVIDPISDTQTKIVSVLFVISGILSVLGSSTIVYKILCKHKKRIRRRNHLDHQNNNDGNLRNNNDNNNVHVVCRCNCFRAVLKRLKSVTPYDRLMLGLSSMDVIASISWILTPFLLPRDTSPRVWAVGNDRTCTFLGTIHQFGVYCAVVYNLMLSLYYLLTVRLGMKRHKFATKYEPYFHIGPLLYFTATSLTGAAIGIYSEIDIGMGCWINDFPKGCEQTGNCTGVPIAWAFGAGPTLLTFLALIVNNIVIYIFVKRKLRRSDPSQQVKSDESPSLDTMNTSSIQSLNSSLRSTTNTNTKTVDDTIRRPTLSSTFQQNQTPNQKELSEHHKQQRREVATQGFLYVVTFMIAYIPSLALRAVEAYATYPVSEKPLFPLYVCMSIFLPLQGFMNMFVYNRPNYARLRLANPTKGIFWTLREACFNSDIPSLSQASRLSKASSFRNTRHMIPPNTNSGSGSSLVNNIHNKRRLSSNSASAGKNFSSSLDIVKEVSHEESIDEQSCGNSHAEEKQKEGHGFGKFFEASSEEDNDDASKIMIESTRRTSSRFFISRSIPISRTIDQVNHDTCNGSGHFIQETTMDEMDIIRTSAGPNIVIGEAHGMDEEKEFEIEEEPEHRRLFNKARWSGTGNSNTNDPNIPQTKNTMKESAEEIQRAMKLVDVGGETYYEGDAGHDEDDAEELGYNGLFDKARWAGSANVTENNIRRIGFDGNVKHA